VGDDPDYGPGGYLPERAAKRARKIVLREPLGKGWIVASLVGAVTLAVIGVVYVLTQTGPPGPPFEDVGAIDGFDPRGATVVDAADRDVLVVRGAGGVQVFEAPGATVVWCRESRRLESADGRVWDASGRLRGGDGESLRPLPAEAHDGVLYVDPHSPAAAATPSASEEVPVCVDG
jgi:hypothetical protein